MASIDKWESNDLKLRIWIWNSMRNNWALIQVNSLGNTADRGFQMPCGWRRVNWRNQERHSKGYHSSQIWFHSRCLEKPVVGRYWAVGWCDVIQLWSKATKARQKRTIGGGRRWCFGPWGKSWDGEIWPYSQRTLKAEPSGSGALQEVREEGRLDAKAEMVRNCKYTAGILSLL